MQKAETKAEEQSKKVEEMQKLMDGLELENATLREKLAASEAELEKLRGLKNMDSEDKWVLFFADPNCYCSSIHNALFSYVSLATLDIFHLQFSKQ